MWWRNWAASLSLLSCFGGLSPASSWVDTPTVDVRFSMTTSTLKSACHPSAGGTGTTPASSWWVEKSSSHKKKTKRVKDICQGGYKTANMCFRCSRCLVAERNSKKFGLKWFLNEQKVWVHMLCTLAYSAPCRHTRVIHLFCPTFKNKESQQSKFILHKCQICGFSLFCLGSLSHGYSVDRLWWL